MKMTPEDREKEAMLNKVQCDIELGMVECPDCHVLITHEELKQVTGEIGLLVCSTCLQNYE